MMRLGIVVALAAEARTLGLRACPAGGLLQLSESVTVCVSGIGPERARAAARRLLCQGTSALLSWGTATALHRGLEAGDVVLPRRILQVDELPVRVCEGWRRHLSDLVRRQVPVADEPLIAVDRVLTNSGEKQLLHTEYGAVAADMESAGIAAVAREENRPFAVLRVIADNADADIPQWLCHSIDDVGRVRPAAWLQCLMHPADWSTILRLSRDFQIALNALQAVADLEGCARLGPGAPRRK